MVMVNVGSNQVSINHYFIKKKSSLQQAKRIKKKIATHSKMFPTHNQIEFIFILKKQICAYQSLKKVAVIHAIEQQKSFS